MWESSARAACGKWSISAAPQLYCQHWEPPPHHRCQVRVWEAYSHPVPQSAFTLRLCTEASLLCAVLSPYCTLCFSLSRVIFHPLYAAAALGWPSLSANSPTGLLPTSRPADFSPSCTRQRRFLPPNKEVASVKVLSWLMS